MKVSRVLGLLSLMIVFLLPAQPSRSAQTLDLTGLWLDNTGGGAVYRVRQIENKIYWSVDGTAKGSFTNVFIGEVSGNSINGLWVDLPGSPTLRSGSLSLRIESNNRLVKVKENPCCYGAESWTRQGSSALADPIVGTWAWGWNADPRGTPITNGTITFTADHKMRYSGGSYSTWERSGNQVLLKWADKDDFNRMTLSADGKVMTGSNKQGWIVRGTKQ